MDKVSDLPSWLSASPLPSTSGWLDDRASALSAYRTSDPPILISGPASIRQKRRFSDTNTFSTPRRSRGTPGPQMRSVSDPLPMRTPSTGDLSTFDDWFTLDFDRSDEISTAGFLTSAPLDITVFDGWSSFDSTAHLQDSARVDLDLGGLSLNHQQNFAEVIIIVSAVEEVDLPADFDSHDTSSINLSSLPPTSGQDFADFVKTAIDTPPGLAVASPRTTSQPQSVVPFQESLLVPVPVTQIVPGLDILSTDVNASCESRDKAISSQEGLVLKDSSFSSVLKPREQPGLDIFDSYTTLSDGELDTYPADSAQDLGDFSSSRPPSFLESMGPLSLPSWDAFWNPFEHLSETALACPPPPYCQLLEVESFPGLLTEVEALESKVCKSSSRIVDAGRSPTSDNSAPNAQAVSMKGADLERLQTSQGTV